MKFGGSSLADTARIEGAATIIAGYTPGKVVVVVSAMGGVTDTLIAAFHKTREHGVKAAHPYLSDLRDKYAAVIDGLPLDEAATTELRQHIDTLESALQSDLQDVEAMDFDDKRLYDRVVSYGERASVLLVAAALQAQGIPAVSIEASELIVTNARFGDAEPILGASRQKLQGVLTPILEDAIIPVVTGFIGATVHGEITTLGRGASDYTSTILAFCLDADKVTIWTDVTGVMTADPRVIHDAQTISALSYEEAAELSFYGAKVLHPMTMLPVVQKNIPVYIKNTFEPAAKGTKIAARGSSKTATVKAVTTLRGLSMITIRGAGATSALQHLAKIIDALLEKNIEIITLQQSSSDHNTVILVRSYVADEAANSIAKLMIDDVAAEHSVVRVVPDVSIVAVVGDGIHALPGLAGQVFSSLAVSGIEAMMIAYGSSKHNLTFAIKTADEHNAIRGLHQAFQLVAEDT